VNRPGVRLAALAALFFVTLFLAAYFSGTHS
jgi:hypothetical protein